MIGANLKKKTELLAGEDASGAPSDGTTDNLIRVTMMQGSNINWANLRVQIEVDNAAPVTCDNPGQDSGAVCLLVPFEGDGGQFWSVGDGVTIQESGQDLCTATCTIDVTITDTREGTVIAAINNDTSRSRPSVKLEARSALDFFNGGRLAIAWAMQTSLFRC